MSLFNDFANFFLYKEQRNQEYGFELLENEDKSNLNDGVERTEGKKQGTQQSNTVCTTGGAVSPDLNATLQALKEKFKYPMNQDVILREFKIGLQIRASIVFMDGMIDKKVLNLSLLPRLMSRDLQNEIAKVKQPAQIADFLIQNIIPINNVKKSSEYETIIKQILNGLTALFIDGCPECILLESRGYEKRGVESPKTEMVVKGSQEGFTENLRTNITLIRRIIKNEHLITEMVPAGETNQVNCAILYIDGITNPAIIKEVKRRINTPKIAAILSPGMKEQLIEDSTYRLVPQMLSTERPDRCASHLLNGHVVFITEGSPFGIIAPINFWDLFHSFEDTNLRWPYATLLRIVRIIGFFLSLLLPALYCAIVMFHPEMLPTELLNSIAQAKEKVPFPTIIEILILDISFELIREGSIRVPSVIGQTLGIVGALILGEAAVQAGLVSPVLVIIISITALGSFTAPDYEVGLTARISRFFFLFAGASFGFFGISLLLFLFVIMLSSMKSFGVPYLAPIAPKTNSHGSIFVKSPIWSYTHRPDELNTVDEVKQGNNPRRWF